MLNLCNKDKNLDDILYNYLQDLEKMFHLILGAVFIALMRVCDVTIGTFRTLLVVQVSRTSIFPSEVQKVSPPNKCI
jgi:uncharacterized membrane protein